MIFYFRSQKIRTKLYVYKINDGLSTLTLLRTAKLLSASFYFNFLDENEMIFARIFSRSNLPHHSLSMDMSILKNNARSSTKIKNTAVRFNARLTPEIKENESVSFRYALSILHF